MSNHPPQAPASATAPTFGCTIHIAGDYTAALNLCREYCDSVGLCVTVTATTYVYTGGQEAGVTIGLINYPRFPTSPEQLEGHANTLAGKLRAALGQNSYTVQGPHRTTWHSWVAQP